MATDNSGRIPVIYRDFSAVVSKHMEKLLPHWSIEHAIELETGYNSQYRQITVQLNVVLLNGVQLNGVELNAVELNEVELNKAMLNRVEFN